MQEELSYTNLEFSDHLIEEMEDEFSSFIGEEFENIYLDDQLYLD